MNLLNTDHCKFCNHKIVNFSKGTFFGLTNKRPDFTNKCSKINLKEEFESKITDINIEYEAVKKTRINAYGLFIINVIIGLIIIIVGLYLSKYIFNIGYISIVPFIIMSISIIPLGKGFGTLNSYNSDLSIAKSKKDLLDYICKLYGYSYNLDIEHLKDSLGNKSYKTQQKVRRTNNSK